jgi:hypothetical protein
MRAAICCQFCFDGGTVGRWDGGNMGRWDGGNAVKTAWAGEYATHTRGWYVCMVSIVNTGCWAKLQRYHIKAPPTPHQAPTKPHQPTSLFSNARETTIRLCGLGKTYCLCVSECGIVCTLYIYIDNIFLFIYRLSYCYIGGGGAESYCYCMFFGCFWECVFVFWLVGWWDMVGYG